MNKYYWSGLDKSGTSQSGFLYAKNEQDLQNQLLNKNIALLDFKIKKDNFFKNLFYRNITLDQKAFLFSQLSILINSSIDIIKAISIIKEQVNSNKLKEVLNQVEQDIYEGNTFSGSLEKYPTIFTSDITNLIKSGENSGKLGNVLENLSENLNNKVNLINSLKQAAIVPILTLIFTIFILLAIFIFVIPQFEDLFNNFDKKLPALTLLIIKISHFIRSIYFLLSLILLLIFIRIFKILDFKKLKDKLIFKMFFISKIFLLYDLISFCQTISTFLKSGVDLKFSFFNSIDVINNSILREKFKNIYSKFTQGYSLEKVLQEKQGFLPYNFVALVTIGQNSGKLDLMLEKSGIIMQKDLDRKLKILVNVFNPILMIFVGIIILFIMLAIYLPIFNMASLV